MTEAAGRAVAGHAEAARPQVQLYASSPSDPRARRPVDALRAVAYLVLLVAAALLSEIGADLDREISSALLAFPGFLQVLWLAGWWGAVVWAIVLVAIAAFDRRPRLALEGVAAAGLALGIAVLAAALVTDDSGDVLARLLDVDGPPVFPPPSLAISSAVLAVMAPYLTLPWRRFGRALVVAQLVGSLFLGSAQTLGAATALTVGLLAGTLVHLVAGSPGGLPTVSRVRDALAGLGVEVAGLEPVAMRRDGVALLRGVDRHGPVDVKVYGRDAWEGELLADLWRLAWYRGTERTTRLGRGQYVEHEGFMTFLAGSAGARVPTVVTAGRAPNGDALIVVRPNGRPLDLTAPTLTGEEVDALWRELRCLHQAGIVHHRIDLDRIAVHDDGTAGFADLSSASLRADSSGEQTDRAQLLALTVVVTGEDRAIDALRATFGDAAAAEVLPHLQEAACAPLVRAELRRRDLELDGLRTRLGELLGAEEPELAKVRRVTWKSLLSLALLAVAASTLIGMVADLDLGALRRSLADANWWWLAAALLIGQLPRVANALSTMGSTTQPLPLGPTTGLHFATCYVNLAVPSSAGKVAVTTRFFQRFGVPPAAAISAGLIDSISEFAVQLTLFVLVLLVADVDLGLSLDTAQLSGVATTALLVVGALLVAVLVALAVPSLRGRLVSWVRDGASALQVLRMPRKLLLLFGGNVLSQVLFALALGACVRAFGYEVPLSVLILVNTIVSLFAGLLPVPGGVGVSEAGISLGLTRAGVPAETAFAAALTYRFCTFYLPPLWGYRTYRWMTAHRYL